jgi:hypothetical protein
LRSQHKIILVHSRQLANVYVLTQIAATIVALSQRVHRERLEHLHAVHPAAEVSHPLESVRGVCVGSQEELHAIDVLGASHKKRATDAIFRDECCARISQDSRNDRT